MAPRPTGYEPLCTLKPVAPEVWVADGPHISFYRMPFPTRMTVVRLADGALWLHSPIAPQGDLVQQVADLGPVRHLVAPNWLHYAALPDWQAAFPQALTWAAPGVRQRAASHGVAIRWDRDLIPLPPADWGEAIDQLIVASPLHSEAVFFHRASRTLILTDLIENFEPAKLPLWMRPIVRLGGVADPDGGMPRDIRASFRRGPDDLRNAVARMLLWAPERVILAHGRWYAENGTAELRRAFRWLL